MEREERPARGGRTPGPRAPVRRPRAGLGSGGHRRRGGARHRGDHRRARVLAGAGRSPGPLNGLLLVRHQPLADRRAGARDRRRQLLRRQGTDVGVHDRLPGAQPGPQPVCRCGDPGRVRPGLHGAAREGEQARGLSPCLHPDLPRHPGPRRDHRAVHPPGAGGDAAVRARLLRDGHATSTVVLSQLLFPNPGPARRHRDGRGHPQQLRPLRGVRDLALLLERGDHRRPRRARARLPRGQGDLRLRDRRAGRDRDPAGDAAASICATPRSACGAP